MIRGEGSIDLIRVDTGEIIRAAENSNVILEQAVRGLAGRTSTPQAPAAQWYGSRGSDTISWRIRVSNGYTHLASDTLINRLDGEDAWFWDSGILPWTISGRTMTTQIEIPANEGNSPTGGITEACLRSDMAWNRLMFKSAPKLPGGNYTYYVQHGIGLRDARYSLLSAPLSQQIGQDGGAVILKWVRNNPSAVDRHYVYRQIGSGPLTLVGVTQNYFFVDGGFGYGFGNLPDQNIYTPTPAPNVILAPTISYIEPSLLPQPKMVVKTEEYAARITMTISFQ